METLETKKPEDVLPVVTKEAIEVKEKEDYEKEIVEEEEAKSDDEEKTDEIKGSSKRRRKGCVKKCESGSKKAKTDSSPVTPIERPTRERKTVERYQESVGRITSPKPFSIEKGTGTRLKDIPNATCYNCYFFLNSFTSFELKYLPCDCFCFWLGCVHKLVTFSFSVWRCVWLDYILQVDMKMKVMMVRC